MNSKILEVKNLQVFFNVDGGIVRAVDDISYDVREKESIGIVGESGSGKSVSSLSMLNLIPTPPGEIVQGEILFKKKDILKMSKSELREIKGNEISIIFQEPMTSLNPVYSIGNQIKETLKIHQKLKGKAATEKAIELLRLVRIPSAEKIVKNYPHQLSGGMRQRVLIAMALACNPKVLICDEPTTALDVTVQAQILKLIDRLRKELDMSVIFISHDLALVSEITDRVIVMYAGRIVEENDTKDIFKNSLHPYTEALMKSIPVIGENKEELYTIKGMVPNSRNWPQGCKFEPRCDYAMDICKEKEPGISVVGNCKVRCWKYGE